MIIVQGNDRDRARMEAMRYVLNYMDYEKKGMTGERLKPDSEIIEVHTGTQWYLIDPFS